MFRNTKKILAMLIALTLIISGTFALQQSIQASNEFMGRGTKEGGGEPVLHDDFDPKTNMKDIYVENLGTAELFVRVKLEEAMSLTSYSWRPAGSDFRTHIYNPAANNCSKANAAGSCFHDYFTWNMGGWKYYKPADGTGKIIGDTKVYTEEDFKNSSLGLRQTPDAKIITAKDFLKMSKEDQKAFVGWIYDTDGYAYWSQPLLPGKATGLLLHGVTTSPSLNNTDYYYVINVTAEAVDREDLPMWLEGKDAADGKGGKMPEATEDGKEVIEIIAGGGGSGGDGGNLGGGDTIAVKPPANPDLGYRSRITGTREDESCWFTSTDKLMTSSLDEPGAIRLEDILVDMIDAEGLKVTPVNPKYDGMFSIGSARTRTCPERADKPCILYTVIPDRETAAAQWAAEGNKTLYPITTQLLLETADGRTAKITVTLEYNFGFVAWEY